MQNIKDYQCPFKVQSYENNREWGGEGRVQDVWSQGKTKHLRTRNCHKFPESKIIVGNYE